MHTDSVLHPREGDLEEKPAEALERAWSYLARNSGILYHVREEDANLGDMFCWSHGCLT